MLSKLTNLFYSTSNNHDQTQLVNDHIHQTDEITAEIDRLKEQIKILELKLSALPLQGSIVVTDVRQVKSGSYTVYDNTKTYIIAKGTFVDGRLIKGEQFGFTWNNQFIITTKQRNSNWSVGSFNSAGLFEGYGESYDGGYDNRRLIVKGTFVNGHLQKGECYHADKWHIGTFNKLHLYEEGEIYADYEKTKLIEKGQFIDNKLVEGKKWDEYQKKWLVGSFDSYGNLISK